MIVSCFCENSSCDAYFKMDFDEKELPEYALDNPFHCPFCQSVLRVE